MRLAFCSRDVQAARRDLVRICSEIREELTADADVSGARAAVPERRAARRGPRTLDEPRRRRSASPARSTSVARAAAGRTSAAPSAELQIIRHALGDVPLAGFFAGGEIARHHLYGYTGVLTVFCAD